jgi:hypothetical protein
VILDCLEHVEHAAWQSGYAAARGYYRAREDAAARLLRRVVDGYAAGRPVSGHDAEEILDFLRGAE